MARPKNRIDNLVATEAAFRSVKLDGIEITATATQMNTLGGAAFDRSVKTARVALAAVDTAGGLFAWQNPEATAVIVGRVALDVTTDATGACTADVGMTATSAATLADNLLDGVDVGAAAGVFDNIENQGTNGKASAKVAVGKWVTGSVASGASAGIVGFAYITYHLI